MEAIESRYVPINYADLPLGINVIEAHQGSGKTERIGDLIGQSTFVVGARKQLGYQLLERHPRMYFGHYENLSDSLLHQQTNLFICYPSLSRLHGKNFIKHTPDNLVIDEANLLWDTSFKFMVDRSNNEIFHRLLEITPRVFIVGASFKEYLLKDLERYQRISID